MKKFLILAVLIIPALAVHAKGILEDQKQADEKARVSYAFGMLMGSSLNSIDLEFDYTAFAEGLKAVIENKDLQFSEQEAMEIVDAAIQKSIETKAEENRLREEAFLAQNSARPEVKVTPSGLQYQILFDTEGEKPKADSIVRVNYMGTFIDGNLFDSSSEEDGSYIPLEMVISGWTEGLQLMSVGSKYRFYIPSSLAYGEEGIQSIIPPYSTLIFTVDLLEIINDSPLNE
uniref:Peptidyl-prolyl cis-trans isomerase n=1 Tax=uncultured bacterium contig00023 TaxID=1181512 RepID=A0A806K039_9BACT|nr:FKBP-type peptidyl-prolyl cis-trans isomerase FklB [uncultured bacterium contig00023]